MRHSEIQWGYCPISSPYKLHGRYRGFDLHRWSGFTCFYPYEGDATRQELQELRDRIPLNGIIIPEIQFHPWESNGETCSLKERRDERRHNYCLTLQVPKLSRQLTQLDTIIDALWQDSGLRQSPEPLPVGRWR